MRKIGALPDRGLAERFADVMTGERVAVRIEGTEEDGFDVWVLDEDERQAAAEALAAFADDPDAERFRESEAAAAKVKQQRDAAIATRAKLVRKAAAWRRPVWRRAFVTTALVGTCVVIAAVTAFGKSNPTLMQALYIAPFTIEGDMIRWSRLSAIAGGEVWRVVSPMLLHFGPLHLIFNMLWLWTLGGAIEIRRGWPRYVLLVLTLAAVSNVAEYFVDLDLRSAFSGDAIVAISPGPKFGGMSGVVFGLVGYIWTRSRLRPASGLALAPQTMTWMLVWFVVCVTGLVGAIANVAHGVGLLAGLACGWLSVAIETTPLGRR